MLLIRCQHYIYIYSYCSYILSFQIVHSEFSINQIFHNSYFYMVVLLMIIILHDINMKLLYIGWGIRCIGDVFSPFGMIKKGRTKKLFLFRSLNRSLNHHEVPMTDPWCWYINANMTGVYEWDPCYHIWHNYMDPMGLVVQQKGSKRRLKV